MMKIEFELDDAGFHKAMDDHISKALSHVTRESLENRVNEILEVQTARIEKNMVERILQQRIDAKLKTIIGSEYEMKRVINDAFLSAAKSLLKEKL